MPASGGTDTGFAVPNTALMSDGEFKSLAQLIYRQTGIVLPISKRQLVVSRLRKRLNLLALDGFSEYLRFLDSPAGGREIGEMTNAITTNLTRFFREPHHFDDMRNVVAAAQKSGSCPDRMRIWTTACSTGEEAYSIALTLKATPFAERGPDLRILATDIDTRVLTFARAGCYTGDQLADCPADLRRSYFNTLSDGRFEIAHDVKNMVVFNVLNLHQTWPMRGPFDFIFCRNVLIYFDAEAKNSIVSRLADLLAPGGTLYMGHAESILGNQRRFSQTGRTIFRKIR